MASLTTKTAISVIDKLLTLVHGLISAIKKRKEQKRVQEIRENAIEAFLDTFNPTKMDSQ